MGMIGSNAVSVEVLVLETDQHYINAIAGTIYTPVTDEEIYQLNIYNATNNTGKRMELGIADVTDAGAAYFKTWLSGDFRLEDILGEFGVYAYYVYSQIIAGGTNTSTSTAVLTHPVRIFAGRSYAPVWRTPEKLPASFHISISSSKYSVWGDTQSPSTTPQITSIESVYLTPPNLYPGQTAQTIAGTSFSASGNTVKISPTNNYADANAVTQTITSEGTTAIDFTVVKGGLAYGRNYLIVSDASSNKSNCVPILLVAEPGFAYVNIMQPDPAGMAIDYPTLNSYTAESGTSFAKYDQLLYQTTTDQGGTLSIDQYGLASIINSTVPTANATATVSAFDHTDNTWSAPANSTWEIEPIYLLRQIYGTGIFDIPEFQTITGAPQNPDVVPGNGNLSITWESPDIGVVFNIYYSDTPGVTTATGTKISSVTSPYVDTVANGTTRYYIITETDGVLESGPSGEVSGTPSAYAVKSGRPKISFMRLEGFL